MPHCRYDVLQNGAEGSPVSTAKVGDTLYHKWSCKDDFLKEMYCMTIVSCYVDDGSSNSFELIDQNGCAKDPILLEDLTYYSDLSAGVETVAFKYADKPSVFFQCRVSLSLKHEHENEICPRPKCNAAEKFRVKRDNRDPFSENDTDSSTPVATFDLDSPKLTILDVDDEYSRRLEQQQQNSKKNSSKI
uniref:ZP domain-containing protein n=1 Tax=Romanomermis culicivorax TaxID=13658 RepID=A0A915KNG2_ROMCU